jgi:ribosomal protein S27E
MTPTPVADVLATRGRFVDIRCPYCGNQHTHGIERTGRTEHRAPGCGINLSERARATGYTFTTERTTERKDAP